MDHLIPSNDPTWKTVLGKVRNAIAGETAPLKPEQQPGPVHHVTEAAEITKLIHSANRDLKDVHGSASPGQLERVKKLADGVVREHAKIASYFDLVDLLALTPRARRSAMWNLANAFNSAIITQVKQQIRRDRFAAEGRDTETGDDHLDYMRSQMDAKTFDEYMDARAGMEAAQSEEDAMALMGNAPPMKPIEIAEVLVSVRRTLAIRMAFIAKDDPRGLAQGIAQSVAFQMQPQKPTSEVALLALALETGEDVAELRRADRRDKAQQLADLTKIAHLVVQTTQRLERDAPRIKDEEVDAALDALPPQVHYRLIGSAIRAIKTACDGELRYLRSLRTSEAIANRALIKDVLNGYIDHFNGFAAKHEEALAEYEATTGFALPTVTELLTPRDE